MQKKLFLLIVLTGCVLVTSAQESKQEQPAKKGCSCSFSSINQVGILHGSKGRYFQFQTVNGIRYKTWFAGLGAGFDYYYRLSFPLFVDVRKDIFNKPFTPFLYADAGVHLANKKIIKINNWQQQVYNNGYYADAGIGYKFGSRSKARWVISSGYSYKNLEYKQEAIQRCTTPPCSETYYTFKNYFHRFSFKLGLQF